MISSESVTVTHPTAVIFTQHSITDCAGFLEIEVVLLLLSRHIHTLHRSQEVVSKQQVTSPDRNL